jgi:transposase-like protein
MERKKDKAIWKGMSGGETVKTRRRWRAEEKLSIIKEAKEGSSVAEVCRKHSIDPSMLARWRESYEIFGLEGLKTNSTAIDPGLRKLKNENERLKKLLAEKDLEVQMIGEAYKKGRGGCHEAGIRLLGFRHKPEKVDIPPLGIPRSSFYSRSVQSPAVRGRKPSSFSLRINGPGIRLITNSEVVEYEEGGEADG